MEEAGDFGGSLSEPSDYKDKRGKDQRQYLLDAVGFALLVRSFNLLRQEDKDLRRMILKKFHSKQKPTGKMISDEYGTKYKPKVLPEAKKIKVVALAAEILGIETGDSLANELDKVQLLTCMIELLDANVAGKKATRKKLVKLIENPKLTPKDVGLVSEYNCFLN
jgi:hypothetical protein